MHPVCVYINIICWRLSHHQPYLLSFIFQAMSGMGATSTGMGTTASSMASMGSMGLDASNLAALTSLGGMMSQLSGATGSSASSMGYSSLANQYGPTENTSGKQVFVRNVSKIREKTLRLHRIVSSSSLLKLSIDYM